MSQSPQQQQQQQDDSDSNWNMTQAQCKPSSEEEWEAWLMSQVNNWLTTDREEWQDFFATEPGNVANTQQPTTVSSLALPAPQGPQQCDASLAEDLHPIPATTVTVTVWTRLQDKAFENALLTCPEGTESRWERIAALVPGGKTPAEVSRRYEELLHDVALIESGHYVVDLTEDMAAAASKVDGGTTEQTPPANGNNRRESRWTEQEHRLFLAGLKNYGKRKWREISRHFVTTRDPQQVASHAEKYFLHQSDREKKRKRKSIHDITIKNNDKQ